MIKAKDVLLERREDIYNVVEHLSSIIESKMQSTQSTPVAFSISSTTITWDLGIHQPAIYLLGRRLANHGWDLTERSYKESNIQFFDLTIKPSKGELETLLPAMNMTREQREEQELFEKQL